MNETQKLLYTEAENISKNNYRVKNLRRKVQGKTL